MKFFSLLFTCVLLLSCSKDPIPRCQKQAAKGALCYRQLSSEGSTLSWTDYHYSQDLVIKKEVFNGNNQRQWKIEIEYDTLNRPIVVKKRNSAFQLVEYEYDYYEDSVVIGIDSFSVRYTQHLYSDEAFEVNKLSKKASVLWKDSTVYSDGQIDEVYEYRNGSLDVKKTYEWFVNGVADISVEDYGSDEVYMIREAYQGSSILSKEIIVNQVVVLEESWTYENDLLVERNKLDKQEEVALKELFIYVD